MKLSTVSGLSGLLAWPIGSLICWAIWNNVIARIFELPHLAYWEMFLIYFFVQSLLPSHHWILGKIADMIRGNNAG